MVFLVRGCVNKLEKIYKKEIEMEVYAFIENKKTGTIHILKTEQNPNGRILEAKARLVFNHKSFNIDDLSDELIPYSNYISMFYLVVWDNISNARKLAEIMANQGYNICANCVRELYKNNYQDID
jgi:hypothetical protein